MNKINYMLRKTIVPWRKDEVITEVVDYCKANNIDEVMWKIDAEVFNHGLTTTDIITEFLPYLEKASVQLGKIGVISSINPWVTLNHSDYGRDNRADFPDMQWMVGHDGTTCTACPCPLSSAWHDYIAKAYSLYARVKPHILWVEDDFRYFNHKPVEWGCFCPIHIKEFSKRIGFEITRAELVKRILSPGKPDELRTKWMEFLGESLILPARKIEKAVHDISPDTKIGLMCAGADDLSIEGRKWYSFLESLCGKNGIIVRPPGGCYRNTEIFDIYGSLDLTTKVVSCLPSSARLCAEIECSTFTEFVKSRGFVRLQTACMAMAGQLDITFNLYDHAGTPLKPDDKFGLMLRDVKPILNGLTEKRLAGGKDKGIGLVFCPDIARYVHTRDGVKFPELYANASGWSVPLQSLGFSVTYKESDVHAITGQITRALTDKQIRQLLSKPLLLDASAAKVLIEDGYGHLLGVRSVEFINKNTIPAVAEDYGAGVYISTRLATPGQLLAKFEIDPAAKVFSNFIDPERKPYMPAVVFYENQLGGRIAVYGMDLQQGVTVCFLSWHRKTQFRSILDWLTAGKIPLFVDGGPHTLPMRVDYPDYILIFVASNTPDDWERINVSLSDVPGHVKQITQLDEQGNWSVCDCHFVQDGDKVTFDAQSSLAYLDFKIFCLNLK